MAHQVFISHATQDRPVAAAVAEALEGAGVPCWLAFRDTRSGEEWSGQIVAAINRSQLVLVIVTSAANKSPHVLKEVTRAEKARVPLLPVHAEDISLSDNLVYYLESLHWFKAFGPSMRQRLTDLVGDVKHLLAGNAVTLYPESGGGGPVAAKVPGRVTPQTLVIDLASRSEPPPDPCLGSYDERVDREKPACVLLLVDESGSMRRRIGGLDIKKKDAVADTINRLLYNSMLTAAKHDGVRAYFDFGIIAYGVGQGVESVLRERFGSDVVSISELAKSPLRSAEGPVYDPNGKRGVVATNAKRPIWYEPRGGGKTLMRAGFEKALALVKPWTASHPASYPPIVVNLTDGGWTEDDPAPVVREIEEQATNVGNTLVFNCHVSEEAGKPITFPGPTLATKFDKRMKSLYDMSSPMPEPMRNLAIQAGYRVEVGARGYAFNADLATLVNLLDVGTALVRNRAR